MINYRVRSIALLNLINDIRKGTLIPDAYFQRNLVWREIHNKDFIKTILLGFPFPQIFISKGKVDIETMTTVSCIVDGQQRSNAIMNYVENDFEVDGRYFDDLTEKEKSDFLKYEIAIIELDLENDDPKVQDIFQRINRTSNSLSIVEKMASKYSTSEFMLVAKLLSNQINLTSEPEDHDFKEDPNIPSSYFEWAKTKKLKSFHTLLLDKKIFSQREIAKKSHLMNVLNIMATVLSDFYNRNDRATEYLNDFAFEFERKDEIVEKLEKAARIILDFKFKAKSYWYYKSNIFTLLVALANKMDHIEEIDFTKVKEELENFESKIPPDYKLAATEGINNKKQRELRNKYLQEILTKSNR